MCMKRRACWSLHWNSASSQSPHDLPSFLISAFASVRWRPISITFSTVCLPSLRIALACSARAGLSRLAGWLWVLLLDIAVLLWFGDRENGKREGPGLMGRGLAFQVVLTASRSTLRRHFAAASTLISVRPPMRIVAGPRPRGCNFWKSGGGDERGWENCWVGKDWRGGNRTAAGRGGGRLVGAGRRAD